VVEERSDEEVSLGCRYRKIYKLYSSYTNIMVELPEISDGRLEELIKEIKPVVRYSRRITSREDKLVQDDKGDLYFIEDVDPRKIAFTWDPKPARMAEEVNPNPYKTIKTIHSYGAPVLFKPSIAEVLAQIPEDDIGRCVAFETDHLGFTEGSSYHLAQTRLYEKLPQRVLQGTQD